MKYLKFFSEGFHVFEDVRHDASRALRLNISGHGIAGGKMANVEFGPMGPEKLISILYKYFRHAMPRYRHIRLLFCHSAGRDEYGNSFAASFSRLLPNSAQVIVEAYQGVIDVTRTHYSRTTNSFEDIS
ncbi:hypothetical protein AB204_15165 [Xenorhabdus khoisanae]|uniref:Uncharacterized protein n=1 Tax=Xenorhabdus khoisanae TaxID=880157 RepID=A0A0J5FQR0_9GAMM|nr:hypothetical protein [Xenorhabdus khoisanae]KMJ44292.1 hypothetical protein AB204_15165 [Xenorhabdus khoisanae]